MTIKFNDFIQIVQDCGLREWTPMKLGKEKFAPTGEFKLKLLENRGDSPNTSMNLQIKIGNGVMLKTKG